MAYTCVMSLNLPKMQKSEFGQDMPISLFPTAPATIMIMILASDHCMLHYFVLSYVFVIYCMYVLYCNLLYCIHCIVLV